MRRTEGSFPWWLGVVGAVFLALVAALVLGSLRRPSPATFEPSPGGTARLDSTGARTVTLDARSSESWVRFDLSAGRIAASEADDWDLAVRRFHVIVNGGNALPGEAAAAPTGETDLSAVRRRPGGGWQTTRADADGELRHPLLERWYEYDFFSHLLEARPEVWAIRTTRGEVYGVRFLSYYCPGPEAGCVTFRYGPLQDGAPVGDGVARGEPDEPAGRGPR